MPPVRAMRTPHERGVRDAFARLTATRASSATTTDAQLPPAFRAPWLIALWAATLLTVIALLAIGRIRVPDVAQGAVVAVAEERDSVALLLLLPPSARSRVHVGQRASLDTGSDTLALDVVGVDSLLLDAATARRRFADPATLVAHLGTPRLVVRLARCHAGRCLTSRAGGTYAASALFGTRSLASYAVSGP